jgi:hypothetical protein
VLVNWSIHEKIWSFFPEPSGVDTGACVRAMRDEDIRITDARYENRQNTTSDLRDIEAFMDELGL